jgi:hypothetical protein
VKKGQLLVELAPRLREFVEPRLPLGVGGAVAWSWLRFRAARCGGHADVAFLHGVVSSCGPCPSSRCRARGGAGRAEVVDAGRHRIIREAELSTGVHCGVPLHELPQPNGSSPLREVGEVVGYEPKMLLRWDWPQHAGPRSLGRKPCIPRLPLGHWDEAAGRRCARRWTLSARCRRSRGSRSAEWPQESV